MWGFGLINLLRGEFSRPKVDLCVINAESRQNSYIFSSDFPKFLLLFLLISPNLPQKSAASLETLATWGDSKPAKTWSNLVQTWSNLVQAWSNLVQTWSNLVQTWSFFHWFSSIFLHFPIDFPSFFHWFGKIKRWAFFTSCAVGLSFPARYAMA